MPCCQVKGIESEFNPKVARKTLKRYRRRGPDRTTQLLLAALEDALRTSDLRDGSILDVGAGVGAVHHALLDGRLSRAIHVDASPAHIAAAKEETERHGHSGRVEFMLADFVTAAGQIEPADVVTLDRVICCYDDMPHLVDASASKARRFYGAVYPRDVPWMRIALRLINLWLGVRRSAFRVFLHPPAAIDKRLRAAGLHRRSRRHAAGWEVVVYERSA